MKKPLSPFQFDTQKAATSPGRVMVAAQSISPARRVTLSIPQSLDDRIDKQVRGFKSTGIVALAQWALEELERTGRNLEITNPE